jgi:hypothetical protein
VLYVWRCSADLSHSHSGGGTIFDATCHASLTVTFRCGRLLFLDAFDVIVQRPLAAFGAAWRTLVRARAHAASEQTDATREATALVLLAEHNCWVRACPQTRTKEARAPPSYTRARSVCVRWRACATRIACDVRNSVECAMVSRVHVQWSECGPGLRRRVRRRVLRVRSRGRSQGCNVLAVRVVLAWRTWRTSRLRSYSGRQLAVGLKDEACMDEACVAAMAPEARQQPASPWLLSTCAERCGNGQRTVGGATRTAACSLAACVQ